MLALWLEDRQLALRDLPLPAPPAGEALVRVLLSGICNTDVELRRGYYPFTGIPGHEFVGVVEDGPSSLMSRRVVGEINAVCHECRACREDRRTHCERRTVLGIAGRNGAFAEYLTLPAENLHIVPDAVDPEIAVFTEPVAAALQIQRQIPIRTGDRILVVGDGKLGQLIALTLSMTGASVTVAGKHRGRNAAEIEPADFDVAIECSGNPEGFETARRAVRPRGTLVLKSTYAGTLTVNASSLVVDEITLVGSRCGPFAPALALLATGGLDPRPLIDSVFDLAEAPAAFERAQEPGVLKVLLRSAAP